MIRYSSLTTEAIEEGIERTFLDAFKINGFTIIPSYEETIRDGKSIIIKYPYQSKEFIPIDTIETYRTIITDSEMVHSLHNHFLRISANDEVETVKNDIRTFENRTASYANGKKCLSWVVSDDTKLCFLYSSDEKHVLSYVVFISNEYVQREELFINTLLRHD